MIARLNKSEATACVAVFFVLAVLWAMPALAHSWYTFQINPVTKDHCCGDSDCEVISNEQWRQVGDQIFVTWRGGKIYSIPLNQAQLSLEPGGEAAACVWGGKLRCFFFPASG